ncbi:MAG: fliI, partial [Sphingomonas bacterium]|nr:fliI [Sphingomonas bacterium]
WSVYEENRDLILMGAYRDGSDATIDAAIARHGEILDFLGQPQKERVDYAASVASLVGSFGG